MHPLHMKPKPARLRLTRLVLPVCCDIRIETCGAGAKVAIGEAFGIKRHAPRLLSDDLTTTWKQPSLQILINVPVTTGVRAHRKMITGIPFSSDFATVQTLPTAWGAEKGPCATWRSATKG